MCRVEHILALRCPPSVVSATSGPPAGLPAGDGWVEITLNYPSHNAPAPSCPGGIAIETEAGSVVAHSGYSAAAHTGPMEGSSGSPGLASGSVSTFALAPGNWVAVSDDQRVATGNTAFSVVAGQATKVTVNLSS